MAYRESDDTLWVGGWEDDTIYHIKGLSWDNPGEVIDSHFDDTMLIAGLAWHCDGYLYVIGSGTQTVYVLTDDGAYTSIESYLLPGVGVFGVGADIDCDGNLWAATLHNKMTYLLDTDRPAYCCGAPELGAVGGEAYPVNKLLLLAPWIGLAVILAGGGSWLVLRRRRV